jgi:hypothetical protein
MKTISVQTPLEKPKPFYNSFDKIVFLCFFFLMMYEENIGGVDRSHIFCVLAPSNKTTLALEML